MIPAFHARALATSFNAHARRPFYAVQAAGLEGRSLVDHSLERRARRAADDIRRIQPTGPYLLAGYSYNGWVAFEVARRLLELGEQVGLLAILDIWAPVDTRHEVAKLESQTRWLGVTQWNPERGPFFDARRRAMFARDTARDRWARITWRVRGWSAGVVPRGSTLQGKLFFKLTEADVRRYRARPLDVDAVVIKAEDFGGWDWLARRAAPDMSWSRLVNFRVDVVPVSGDHITMLEDDAADELAEVLADAIDARAVRRSPAA
jgi:thioesterase domain-containing protein